MTAYIFKRTAYALPILLGVNLLVFAMFFLVNSPDDMARQALGEKAATSEQIAIWKHNHGYDLPLFFNANPSKTIFFRKCLALFWGNFGRSDQSGLPIGREIAERFAPSFCIALPSFFLVQVINVFFAMKCARNRGRALDLWGQAACVVLMSISTIVLIIFAQFLCASSFNFVPISGYEPEFPTVFKFLALPIVIGVVVSIGPTTRLYRTFFLEQMNQDFVRTARAKGLSENCVLFKHVLRNALIPILTNVPNHLLALFTGNMILEKFFNIPGLGGYAIEAIAAQDFSVVRVMVFLGAALYILGQLVTDLAYCVADPRITLK